MAAVSLSFTHISRTMFCCWNVQHWSEIRVWHWTGFRNVSVIKRYVCGARKRKESVHKPEERGSVTCLHRGFFTFSLNSSSSDVLGMLSTHMSKTTPQQPELELWCPDDVNSTHPHLWRIRCKLPTSGKTIQRLQEVWRGGILQSPCLLSSTPSLQTHTNSICDLNTTLLYCSNLFDFEGKLE